MGESLSWALCMQQAACPAGLGPLGSQPRPRPLPLLCIWHNGLGAVASMPRSGQTGRGRAGAQPDWGNVLAPVTTTS